MKYISAVVKDGTKYQELNVIPADESSIDTMVPCRIRIPTRFPGGRVMLRASSLWIIYDYIITDNPFSHGEWVSSIAIRPLNRRKECRSTALS